jgi:hypothetical protein
VGSTGQGARSGTPGQPVIASRPEVVPKRCTFHAIERVLLLGKPAGELTEVTTVRFNRPRAQIAFNREVGQVVLDVIVGRRFHAIMLTRISLRFSSQGLSRAVARAPGDEAAS